jgi:hypothetical protein
MTPPDIQKTISTLIDENASLRAEVQLLKTKAQDLEDELSYALSDVPPPPKKWLVLTLTGGTKPKELERFDEAFADMLKHGMKCVWQAIGADGMVYARFTRAEDDDENGLDNRLYTLPHVDDFTG